MVLEPGVGFLRMFAPRRCFGETLPERRVGVHLHDEPEARALGVRLRPGDVARAESSARHARVPEDVSPKRIRPAEGFVLPINGQQTTTLKLEVAKRLVRDAFES